MTATFYVGDAIEVMNKLPAASVDLVLSSPPFLALRSYLPADHVDKSKEGGSQATPGEYIDWLVDVAEACARVLAPHGSLCFELGDTYAGSSGSDDPKQPINYRGPWKDRPLGDEETVARRLERQNYGPAAAHNETQWRGGGGWPLGKSLSLIPELFRLTLVYGVNPLTGRQTERWRLRNVIRWVRPNPPVGALGDKFRPATSELMVFCKSAKRYFDLDAVREPAKDFGPRYAAKNYDAGGQRSPQVSNPLGDNGIRIDSNPAGAPPLDWWELPDGNNWRKPCEHGQYDHHYVYPEGRSPEEKSAYCPGGSPVTGDAGWEISLLDGEEAKYGPKPRDYTKEAAATAKRLDARNAIRAEVGLSSLAPSDGMVNQLGAPPLDWWNIPPGGYQGAHYAVFPPELCVRPIKAMSPEKVCKVCGEPRRRIVGEAEYIMSASGQPPRFYSLRSGLENEGVRRGSTAARRSAPNSGDGSITRSTPTLGFSDCGHDDWRPGLVLDPFAGSGTTLAVATGHGRDAIGIDLDERNYDLTLERVGPILLERGEIR